LRAVLQRVHEASVSVDSTVIGEIEQGLLLFVGVDADDSETDATLLAEKVSGLRCFEDSEGKFNLSVLDVEGSVLVISQFTLHGDCRKGRRPSFIQAARPEVAEPLYESVARLLRARGLRVATGSFGAHMEVASINDGPVTLLIDTKKGF
jgi:D-tyrosyl-tRNA(Tyr) deacylase